MGTQLTIVECEMVPVLEAGGLLGYEDYISCEAGEVVGESRRSQMRRLVIRWKEHIETLFLKRYRYEGKYARWAIREDTGLVEARNYRLLREQCGVNVPDVVAYGSRRRGWRLVDSFILTRCVPDAVSLDSYAEDRWPDIGKAATDTHRRQLLEQSADMVSRMHTAGFFHVDLQWRNILVSRGNTEPGGDTDSPTLYVIDSARGALRKWGVLREHGRLRDLSSLYKEARSRLTRRECVCWLRRYFGVDRLSTEHHAMVRTILLDRESKDGVASR